uniref:Uncharacterized protein n=1 Tax=Anguilla anguilla TaxID=7936 RepID=A0A0E9QBY7_ANGAN
MCTKKRVSWTMKVTCWRLSIASFSKSSPEQRTHTFVL